MKYVPKIPDFATKGFNGGKKYESGNDKNHYQAAREQNPSVQSAMANSRNAVVVVSSSQVRVSIPVQVQS